MRWRPFRSGCCCLRTGEGGEYSPAPPAARVGTTRRPASALPVWRASTGPAAETSTGVIAKLQMPPAGRLRSAAASSRRASCQACSCAPSCGSTPLRAATAMCVIEQPLPLAPRVDAFELVGAHQQHERRCGAERGAQFAQRVDGVGRPVAFDLAHVEHRVGQVADRQFDQVGALRGVGHLALLPGHRRDEAHLVQLQLRGRVARQLQWPMWIGSKLPPSRPISARAMPCVLRRPGLVWAAFAVRYAHSRGRSPRTAPLRASPVRCPVGVAPFDLRRQRHQDRPVRPPDCRPNSVPRSNTRLNST